MTPKISIIHPSRSRPEQAAQTAKKWLSSAKDSEQVEYILSLDTDDINLQRYNVHMLNNASRTIKVKYWDPTKEEPEDRITANPAFKVVVNDNRNAIEAINRGAEAAKGNILIVVSDDFDCPYHWDVALLKALQGKSDYVVKTDDGCQPWIITLPIMDRAYYNRFGYIYNPQYQHMFCDTEMTHVADLLGRKIVLPIKFPHNHYTQVGGQPYDQINKKNDSTWAQGEAMYLERLVNNFGLIDPPGRLEAHESHLSWLESKGINHAA